MQLATFIHQKSYEHIELKIRKHLVTAVPTMLLFVLLLAVPVILRWFVGKMFPGLFEMTLVHLGNTLVNCVYYLSIGLFFYTYFVNFYLDILVITNDRLMHVEQQSIFARTISEVDLYKIQDITSTISGFFESMFDYGNLLIQTAGAAEKFQIDHVPHPEALRQRILDLAEEDRKFHSQTGTVATTTN